jgi:hypothetical protein
LRPSSATTPASARGNQAPSKSKWTSSRPSCVRCGTHRRVTFTPITTISITGTFGRPDAYQFAPLPGAGDGYTVPAAPPGVGALSPGQMDTYQQQRRRGPLLCWDDNGDPQEIRVDGAGAVYTSPVTPP